MTTFQIKEKTERRAFYHATMNTPESLKIKKSGE